MMIHFVNLSSIAVEDKNISLDRYLLQLTLFPIELLRQQLDAVEISNPQVAKLIAKVIPAQCPFARDIVMFGRKIAHVPPLCKLNPFYEQFVGLRFRALCYLADGMAAKHLVTSPK